MSERCQVAAEGFISLSVEHKFMLYSLLEYSISEYFLNDASRVGAFAKARLRLSPPLIMNSIFAISNATGFRRVGVRPLVLAIFFFSLSGCATSPHEIQQREVSTAEWVRRIKPSTSEFDASTLYPMPQLEFAYKDGTVIKARLVASKNKKSRAVSKALTVEVKYVYASESRFYNGLKFVGGDALDASSADRKVLGCLRLPGLSCDYSEALTFVFDMDAEQTSMKFGRFQLHAQKASGLNVSLPKNYIDAFNQIVKSMAES